jgi:hypothetical protein
MRIRLDLKPTPKFADSEKVALGQAFNYMTGAGCGIHESTGKDRTVFWPQRFPFG